MQRKASESAARRAAPVAADSARAAAPPAAPAPAPAPAAAPPPPVVTKSPAESLVVNPAADRAGVEAAILAYARALEAGDLGLATRLYPGMSSAQRQGLEAFWNAGGTMKTRWTVSDIAIEGDHATASIRGVNIAATPRDRPSEQRVSLRARLERRGAEWHLVTLAN